MTLKTLETPSDTNPPHLLLFLPYREPVDVLDRIRKNHPQLKITYRQLRFSDSSENPWQVVTEIPRGTMTARNHLTRSCRGLTFHDFAIRQNYFTMLQFLRHCPCSRHPRRTLPTLVLRPSNPLTSVSLTFPEFIQLFSAGLVSPSPRLQVAECAAVSTM